jgi:ABC-2 type transport system permease protein
MLIFSYTLSVILMILTPVFLAVWLRRAAPAAWLLFGLGCLTFGLSQVVHFPLNAWLADLGWLPGKGVTLFESGLSVWRAALTLGLTAGLCEELLRFAGYLFLRQIKPAWLRLPDALMLGLGHGGIEAMVFGGVLTAATLSALLPLQNADLAQLGLNAAQLQALETQLARLTADPARAALPWLERLLAISAHVTFSLLVWKAFVAGSLRRGWVYIPLAVAYHAAVDAVAVWAAYEFEGSIWMIEGLLALALLPGWIWAIWQIRSQPRAAYSPAAGLREEWRVWGVALIKELRQLWRTRRLLVMGAIFLVFGMGSPLLAKFTPQMLSSIEGAEMFADLIPEPTAGDGMVQYIKNISQFGFILAVMLGMGAVAGEKERGVAALILSKPMPRWAFLTSKFAAQALMYAGGFALAGLGAYYYSWFLFGPLAADSFLLLNILLLLWLLTFVALSLLGSALGASTAAAGGIGLGLSVLLMLAGAIPQIVPLLPGALLGWASQLGQAAAGVPASMPGEAANASGAITAGGAAAAALVVITMAMVLSLGVFEQQEL